MKVNLCIMIISLFALVANSFSEIPGSTLGTATQRELEARALRVFASPEVQERQEMLRSVYANDPVAKTEAGASTLDAALDSITMAMVLWAVNDDPARPKLFWSNTAAHEWMGLQFPNSGYGIENPDNVYRHAPLDGRSRYEIRGVMPANPPAQQSFTLYATLPGTGKMNREGSSILGALDRVVTAGDGSFTVTIDRDPADGRPNHIQSGEKTALLIIRDSLTNWETQDPGPLTIHRVSGPPPGPPFCESMMAMRAASLMQSTVPFWADYNNALVYPRAVNTVGAPKRRGGGWGYGMTGHFDLASSQGLVVTLDPKDASYLGFQLADPWGVGLEYVHRSGSISLAQAEKNADGTVTYVIASTDPGVYNWLDTSGLDRGIFAIRWQDVPAEVTSAEGMVRSSSVVSLADLRAVLPAGTRWVNAGEREQQRDARRRSFEKRLQ